MIWWLQQKKNESEMAKWLDFAPRFFFVRWKQLNNSNGYSNIAIAMVAVPERRQQNSIVQIFRRKKNFSRDSNVFWNVLQSAYHCKIHLNVWLLDCKPILFDGLMNIDYDHVYAHTHTYTLKAFEAKS